MFGMWRLEHGAAVTNLTAVGVNPLSLSHSGGAPHGYTPEDAAQLSARNREKATEATGWWPPRIVQRQRVWRACWSLQTMAQRALTEIAKPI